jgi:hypothetical protein
MVRPLNISKIKKSGAATGSAPDLFFLRTNPTILSTVRLKSFLENTLFSTLEALKNFVSTALLTNKAASLPVSTASKSQRVVSLSVSTASKTRWFASLSLSTILYTHVYILKTLSTASKTLSTKSTPFVLRYKTQWARLTPLFFWHKTLYTKSTPFVFTRKTLSTRLYTHILMLISVFYYYKNKGASLFTLILRQRKSIYSFLKYWFTMPYGFAVQTSVKLSQPGDIQMYFIRDGPGQSCSRSSKSCLSCFTQCI